MVDPPKKQTKSRSGCVTCKKRRLKCDETKPTCLECARRKVQCGGYAKNFKWRSFEETNVCARINKQQNNTPAQQTKQQTHQRSNSITSAVNNPHTNNTTQNGKAMQNGNDKNKSIDSLIHAASAAMVPGNRADKREAHAPANTTAMHPNNIGAVNVSGNNPMADKSGDQNCKDVSGNKIEPPSAANNNNTGKENKHPSVNANAVVVVQQPPSPPHNYRSGFSPFNAPSPSFSDFMNNLPSDLTKWNGGMENNAPSPTFSAIFGSGISEDNFSLAVPSPKDIDMLDFNTKIPPQEQGQDEKSKQQKESSLVSHSQYAWGNGSTGANDRLQGWLADIFDPAKQPEVLTANDNSPFSINLGPIPANLIDSHEQTFKLYDRYTCGVLSIKDGPTENPWRTVMWPLAQDYGALYHAVAAMTKFHTARSDGELRSQAMHHMKESFNMLSAGLSNKTLPPDIALATTLSLAFAEAWDRHITTGIAHLRGAAAMLKQLLNQHNKNGGPLPPWLQFLFNSWLYLDVCARLTADDDQVRSSSENSIVELANEEIIDENPVQMLLNNDVFEDSSSDDNDDESFGGSPTSNPKKKRRDTRNGSTSSVATSLTSLPAGPLELKNEMFVGQQDEVDPLLGCAQTLFPLIGKVATLVQKVRKSNKNSLSIVSEAVELKHQLEQWNASLSKKMTLVEDPTWDLNSCLATAESYRYASLLYLHQAVPEVPSLSSHELAEKVMMLLASIPTSSRTSVVHIFPLLIAGCEANGEERAWVRERWRKLSERMWLGNVDRTVEIVKEVWLRKDTSRKERENRQKQATEIHKKVANNTDDSLAARRSSRDIASSIASRVAEAFGGAKSADDPEDEGIKGWCHWSVVMKEWGWEVLLG